MLLTLLTLSLGTLVVNAETKDSDFVIENGVLKQYKGNDDTVYIPEGVTKIATYAFKNNEIYNDKSTYAFEDDNYILLTDKFLCKKDCSIINGEGVRKLCNPHKNKGISFK